MALLLKRGIKEETNPLGKSFRSKLCSYTLAMTVLGRLLIAKARPVEKVSAKKKKKNPLHFCKNLKNHTETKQV